MKKIMVTISIFTLLLSCVKKNEKEFYIDKIKKGMTTEEVIKILGMPNDSSKYYNHEKEFITIYQYEEEKFSDYKFNVTFNDSLIVIGYDYY